MRKYGQWVGNKEGYLENNTKCVAIVSRGGGFSRPHQCQHKRGHGVDGLLCKQHAKIQAGNHRMVWIPEDEEE